MFLAAPSHAPSRFGASACVARAEGTAPRSRRGARCDQETGHSAEAKAAKSGTSGAPAVYGMGAATWGWTVSLAPAFAVRIAVRFGVLLRQNTVLCGDSERQAGKKNHFRVSKMRTLHLGFPSLRLGDKPPRQFDVPCSRAKIVSVRNRYRPAERVKRNRR